MSRRVYLHIGLPKTGTTAVQEMLWLNLDALAAVGVCYPGYVHTAHFLAAIDLQPQRYRDWLEPLSEGAWDRLAEHVRSWPGTSVISCELLAMIPVWVRAYCSKFLNSRRPENWRLYDRGRVIR